MIFDDEISTGGTLMETVHVLDKYGAKSIYAAATHGILVGEAIERIIIGGIQVCTMYTSFSLTVSSI